MNKKDIILLAVIFFMIIVICASVQKMNEPPQAEPVNTTETTTENATESTTEPLPMAEQPEEPTQIEPYTRYPLTEYERTMVERVVTAEAQNQSLDGQMAVAQCILNTAEAKGIRPDAVVLAPGQYAPPAQYASDSAKQAVSSVFDLGIEVVAEPIRYFYAPKYSSGSWHESSLEYVCTIQDHKFFKLP